MMPWGDLFSLWLHLLAVAWAVVALSGDRSPVWWNCEFQQQIASGWWPAPCASPAFHELRPV
jgi:hypothetical protein